MNLLSSNLFMFLMPSKSAREMLSPNPLRKRVGFYNTNATANVFLWFNNTVNANIGFNIQANPGFLEFDIEQHGQMVQGSWWSYYNTVATAQLVILEVIDQSIKLGGLKGVSNKRSGGNNSSRDNGSCSTAEQETDSTNRTFRAYRAFIRRLRG